MGGHRSLQIEIELEEEGRLLAELPGVMAYGQPPSPRIALGIGIDAEERASLRS